MVMLNDYEPDILYSMVILYILDICAGEIYSFDWYAGHGPRCTLLVTGVATEETHKLFSKYDNKIEV